ncbi:class I SAM-dependent methyltransferase [Streptomyces sp. 7N604]|uniref:class I SAM-dependent methyltransferase n=1 Tax=Streptomyces sp. 7N604 TaxID=3457415 RepID=UPI003FD10FBB
MTPVSRHQQPDDHKHPDHPDHHADSIDWEAFGDQLERDGEIHLPALEQAMAWLRSLIPDEGHAPAANHAPAPAPEVSRVLDVGSGPGVASALLARVFPGAEVVAVDGEPSLLERAGARAVREGLADRVRTHQADLTYGISGLGTADVIWTRQVIHHLGDQQAALSDLGAVLRPGGLLAVVERGLTARFLPRDIGTGRPGLQARLDAAAEDWFAEMRTALPGHTPAVEDWPAMLAGAGLTPAGTRSFLVDLPAPLGVRPREYLQAQLTRVLDKMGDRLAPDDLDVLKTLTDPESPSGILGRPDAFYLAAMTVHTARNNHHRPA